MLLHIISSINIIEAGKKGEKNASKTTPHFVLEGTWRIFCDDLFDTFMLTSVMLIAIMVLNNTISRNIP